MTEDSTRFRWRLAGCSVILIGLAMTQSPGLLIADTKLDLAIAPLDFLDRAAHLWNANGTFGQLQNQAYGYLWPMGPFFAIGDVVGLPAWVVQRLWLALVLVVAFLGAALVTRRLGVRSDLACLVAGFAYALSPRMLTILGSISIEAWPSALAPWVLLPLVVGAERGSPRRAAALSALAVAMVGGVNAAATSAVLPLGALWLLTRQPGPRRRSLMLWWPVFTIVGTLWWLIPLFLLGAYSPPFLDYIEAAANTTATTTLFDALRGTSNWVPFIDPGARAGNDLIRQPYLVVNSVVLLMLGVIGLTLPRNRHRGFLWSGVAVGLFLVTMGHEGSVQGWFAPELRSLMDGPLAPLRNIHKFDPVIRLPLVVGLAFCIHELTERLAATRSAGSAARGDRVTFRTWTAIAVVAVVGASVPIAVGRVAPAASYTEVPSYWAEAADWLGDQDTQGVALLVPGSSFGSYQWGFPRDEPFQALASTQWAVRDAVPLTPAGNIRMLDAIESRLAQGRGSAGLTAYLRRAGVTHLVMRNDLARGPDTPDPVLVHQAMADSPGIDLVADFGPTVGGAPVIFGDIGRTMVNGGWQAEYPAIEVFAVTPGAFAAETTSTSTVVVGGPEDLLDLADAGLLADAPVQLAADLPELAPGTEVILTDGLRNVERNFGRLHDSTSATRSAGDELSFSKVARDYLLPDADRWSTGAGLVGAAAVTASSSQSDADAYGAVQPSALPYAALDGDPFTGWAAGDRTQDGRWWQLEFDDPVPLGQLTITVGNEGNEELQVTTDDWQSPPLRFRPNDTRLVVVPGSTRTLRIEDVSGFRDNRLVITEVVSDQIDVQRELILPALPEDAMPDAVLLRRLSDARNGCAVVDDDVRCLQGIGSIAEEATDFRRSFTLPQAVDYPISVTVSPRPGRAFDQLALTDQAVGVTASSVGNPDPRSGPVAAIDGDPHTTWTASVGEIQPALEFDWLGKETISGLALNVDQDTAARAPQSLRLSWPGGSRYVELNESGSVQFLPVRTNRLTVAVVDAEPANDIRFDGSTRVVPIGISEIVLTGLPYLPVALPTDPIQTACGTGPALEVNGTQVSTRVIGAPADLFAGQGGEAVPCDVSTVALAAGANSVAAIASDAFVVDSIVLGTAAQAPTEGLEVRRSSPVAIGAEMPDAGPLVTHMNVNPGWKAEQSGAELTPAVFDGWRQGWLSRDTGPVEARFGPDLGYRLALGIGLLGVLLLLFIAVRRPRRDDTEMLATPARPASGLWLAAGVLVSGAVLAGPGGLLTSAAALGAGLWLHRREPNLGGAWAAVLLLPAGGAYFFRPWGAASLWAGYLDWPQVLVVAACCVAAGWVAADFGVPRWPRRTPGSSTTR